MIEIISKKITLIFGFKSLIKLVIILKNTSNKIDSDLMV